ncbi:reprolysin-like metallopeptidase [Flavobacterium beibuense]|uniref:PPE-repeat protein n=1 Tax=Flavobacterium beibuense TaxID=657326 RepID=A0A444WHE9_9FLAO|nr:T9SS type A sorting domain-containing protein [Flavobacterium beibuense]RYJ45166.1 PPE-repeat protein [Flavobacterium beibuense]
MLKNKIITVILCIVCCQKGFSQEFDEIFTNVESVNYIYISGSFLIDDETTVTPLINFDSCQEVATHFSVVAQYENGKVIAIGDEYLFLDNNIVLGDNLQFLINVIDWLNSGTGRVTLKEEFVDNNNTTILQNSLFDNNYTFNSFTGHITTSALLNTDILILGNDWNELELYSTAELEVLESFIANGGSLLLAGNPDLYLGEIEQYSMNQVANLFGFEITECEIASYEFQIFYPETLNPYCTSPYFNTNIPRGDNLRIFRMAVSTIGEFTENKGGVNNTSQLIDEWLETINEIYGREYCMRFELIPNNDLLIFENSETDPWETLLDGAVACTDVEVILNNQGSIIDEIIGAENYDLSHVIATFPYLGGGCAADFKRAISGDLNISVCRHEIGHQFSQAHTINNETNNYEPENGNWTIQGGNDYGYAHGVSYHQLAQFLLTIPSVGSQVPTGNTIPTINVGPDVVIPVSTPFTITAISIDPDPDDNLTYVWDNFNPAPQQFIPVPDDTKGALFMRLTPGPIPSRTFPKMSDVIANNNSNAQEQLPTHPRNMDIRVTVNDNHKMEYNGQMINASGINSDDIRIIVADAGPFQVTSQNTDGIVYAGGSTQIITWDVNGTDVAPVNTQDVSITLSDDGGYTYPVTLLSSTPNNGSATVVLPDINIENARIRVAANNSIYFDINTVDFKIQSTLSLEKAPLDSLVNIYPNPSKDYFIIEFTSPVNFDAKLYDVAGRTVTQQFNHDKFDVRSLSQGTYILEITDLETSQKTIRKIFIER